jgi:hypothetical protein
VINVEPVQLAAELEVDIKSVDKGIDVFFVVDDDHVDIQLARQNHFINWTYRAFDDGSVLIITPKERWAYQTHGYAYSALMSAIRGGYV